MFEVHQTDKPNETFKIKYKLLTIKLLFYLLFYQVLQYCIEFWQLANGNTERWNRRHWLPEIWMT